MKRLSEIENFTARLTCHESELRWITWRVLRVTFGVNCELKEAREHLDKISAEIHGNLILRRLSQFWQTVDKMKRKEGETAGEYFERVTAGKEKHSPPDYIWTLAQMQNALYEIAEAL